ncbi:MAG TPA: EAL domain-containing protein [Acidimicrobiia bacterium]|nr:EAL domain-containing protein [Acidimicrobiia bacterium]
MLPKPEFLAAIVENSTNVIAIVGGDGSIRYVNNSAQSQLGYHPSEVVGRSGLDWVHPDDLEALTELVFESDGTARTQIRIRSADGSWRHFECALADRRDDQRIQGLVVSMRDITERVAADAERRDAESWGRSLVANARDVVGIVDNEGRVTYMSPSVRRVLGWDPEELIGMLALDGLHPDDRDGAAAAFEAYVRADGGTEPVEYRVMTATGEWCTLEAVVTDLRDDPAVRGVVLNARDVTDRRRAEALLASQTDVLEMIARGEPLPATLDRIVAMIEDHVSGSNPAIVVGGEAGISSAQETPGELESEERGWSQPIVDADTEGEIGRVVLRIEARRFPCDEQRRVAEIAASLAAIAINRVRALEQLAHQARHDPLTGLPNRTVFLDRLEVATASSVRREDTVAVLFLDLDSFKDVNDTRGHDIGDGVLSAVARRLERAVRAGDTVARFGGDEFAVLCHVDGAQHAQLVATRILELMRRPFLIRDATVELTVSVGIALASEHVDTEGADEVLRNADVAMYRAKERGRARAVIFDDTLRTRLTSRVEMETALRHALTRDEFDLAYQPIFSLADGRPVAVETLLRWNRPGRGLVLPADFIDAADALGLMVPIGEWVLRRACGQLAQWRAVYAASAPKHVTVNVSVGQLLHPDFVESVRSVLDETGVPPDALCIEITEGCVVRDLVGALLALDGLRDLGVGVWLDDFGTGYSSLEYLRQLPVDGLKLDRTFIRGLGDPEVRTGIDDVMVGSVVTMAHALGMVVVAEGIEHERQRRILAELGCDLGQGFLLTAPLPAEACAEKIFRPGARQSA